jgi:hypothetical protein
MVEGQLLLLCSSQLPQESPIAPCLLLLFRKQEASLLLLLLLQLRGIFTTTTTMTRFLGLCLSSQSDLNLYVACIIHPSPCFCCYLDRCKEEKGSSSCRATRSSYKTKEIQQSRLIIKASHQGHSNVRHGGAAQDGSKEVQLLWAG